MQAFASGHSEDAQQAAPDWHTPLQQRPLAHWASVAQLRQALFTHTAPAQSAEPQQSPVSQRPAQHFLPWPQSESAPQATQVFPTHCRSTPHSGVAQQLPCLQDPPQHTASAPHSSLEVHARHAPSRHAVLGAQSDPEQQVAPGRQRLLQHLPPAQSVSPTHDLQELSMQDPPEPQSDEPQQSPVTQAAVPPSRRGQHLPMPHWPSSEQGRQAPPPPSTPMQGPPPQVALTGLVQHSAVTHAPPQQRSPAAHCRSEVQAEHW